MRNSCLDFIDAVVEWYASSDLLIFISAFFILLVFDMLFERDDHFSFGRR